MSQLIQMRQRIKAIETIKKITQAMRIISMSLHGRLKNKEAAIGRYKDGIHALFFTLKHKNPTWINPFDHGKSDRKLIIVIGSNKGLTGNFNTSLFKFLEQQAPKSGKVDFIVIGKKAVEYLKNKKNVSIIKMYTDVSLNTLFIIAPEISSIISEEHYASVKVYSNKIRNFFIQKPSVSNLINLADDSGLDQFDMSDYIWEQKPEEILNALVMMMLNADIQYLIFESLLAEQAARFISMDSSTRNAKNLLDETKLQYNKLRQAKITKELTELTGSF